MVKIKITAKTSGENNKTITQDDFMRAAARAAAIKTDADPLTILIMNEVMDVLAILTHLLFDESEGEDE